MKILRNMASLVILAAAFPASGQGRVQAYLDSLSQTVPFASARMGVLAVKAGGDTVACLSPDKKITPASNVKLITTGLAMKELGTDYRFQTKIGYSGAIENGVLKGDLYIIGGGDPSLASRDSIAPSEGSVFARWKALLTGAGINRIDGRIIGDGRYFDGEREHPSWLYEDIGTYYGSGTSGLSYYRNQQDFKAVGGEKPGDPVKISPVYPDTPWMKYSYSCTTGKAGTGDLLFLYTSDLYPVGEVRGTFAVDKKPKTVECSNKFPAYTCAFAFSKFLTDNNISSRGVAYVDSSSGKICPFPGERSDEDAAPSPAVIGSTRSPALGRMAYIVNHRSDNFYAECLYREIGKTRTGSACYDSCRVAEKRILSSMGLAEGANLYDGSGLSRKNGVSPGFFCKFLRQMLYSPFFESYLRTLTKPGEGSQAGRLRSESAARRDRVRYKSGSMEGVRCYSGYVIPSDGGKDDTIIFSVMLDSYDGPLWMATSRIDRIIALIASEN